MKHKLVLLSFLLATSASAQAEWFLRGTHNAWAATPMNPAGTNTVELTNVVFTAAGNIKFDRYGDWSENYGVGGRNGTNIAVAQGTWNIRFYTDTKNWNISAVTPPTPYHLRGTFNGWAEGTLLTRVGTTDVYESCQQFVSGDATGGPRFKVDPNGGWGSDAVPATDYTVAAGWVKITFNASSKAITTQQNLAANCGSATISSSSSSSSSMAPSSSSAATTSSSTSTSSASAASVSSSSSLPAILFHLRGTHNAWAEGDVFVTPAGTNQLEACRNFSAGDANGGPRFKVDRNGGWGADAFPAADQVASGWTRIVINTSTNSLVSVTTNLAANCGTASASSLSSSSSSSSSSAPVADDFRARTMYFVFVDRFANGNTNNDNGTNPAATSTVKGAGAQSEWKKYWGGDIEGLISKLDYLQALGVTAIWVTPLVDNINEGNEGGYHGYWARDFYAVDEHLGDWALVDELDAQMEARGMKLVLDIALNHSNQDDQYEFGALYKEGAFITDFASGKNTWYNANGAISDCGDTNPATTCNGEWDDPWSFRNKSLFNLTDFKHGTTSNSLADEYLINAALKWMDHGVDAFRIDAIKHIEPSFINRFSAAVRAKKADTYIFGEWYNAGAGDAVSMTFLNERRGSELLDFKLRDAIENAIAGNINMINLSTHIGSRGAAMNGYEDWQAIFLDNHDATRTSVYLQTTGVTNSNRPGKGMTKAFADARQNLGMALVMTLPGIPTIYYGTEQNSTWFTANGDGQVGHDPYNREQMPSFSQTTTAFSLISALSELRKNSPAIQRGTYAERWVNADVLVFQRQEGSDCAVVAVNRGSPTTITVPNLCLANAAYTSKVGSDVVNVTSGSGTFNLSQNEVVVLH
ncbi:alpha-amylase [Cellvibrio mixtus]|uniref:Alpha-amylase n=1 Tax=Cellvibrio mixtus TaxID=39650 RepID=A0A266Q3Z1_9GAMM|nr:alpha-amylase family glycosyl hydrolase [Cellvibrio mixtus]OZY84597.1 alpha-amylase [Cellvibrio mixtus]